MYIYIYIYLFIPTLPPKQQRQLIQRCQFE